MNENWTPKNPPPELSDSDAELLSAYIDNMLDAQERANLEARLASDAFLRSELAAMRQMLGWLKTMPTLKAPRNFTITEADVKPAAPKVISLPRRNNSWQIAASAAAVFVLILAGAFLLNQLDFTPKELGEAANSNDVALMYTETQSAESRDFFAETETAPLLATVGPPPQEISNAAAAEEEPEEQDDSTETGRSAPTDFGSDTETSATGNNAQEPAPQGANGSSGTSGGSGNTGDEQTSTAFGGGAADGQLADIQIETTSTSVAQPVFMPTMTAQASPSPEPTMNAQVETSLFEATAMPDTAESDAMATASPVAETMIVQPTMAVVTGEVVLVSPTVETVQEESMMTMSIAAESTESPVDASAPVLGNADNSETSASGTTLATAPQDLASRINEILRRILLDILEN